MYVQCALSSCKVHLQSDLLNLTFNINLLTFFFFPVFLMGAAEPSVAGMGSFKDSTGPVSSYSSLELVERGL